MKHRFYIMIGAKNQWTLMYFVTADSV